MKGLSFVSQPGAHTVDTLLHRVLPTSQREFPSSIAYRLPYMKEEGTPYLGGDHVNNPCLAPCRSPTRPIGGPV